MVPTVKSKILNALRTYQWRRSATVLHFAMHIKHSEGYTLKCLRELMNEGKVEMIPVEHFRGCIQYNYRLIENDETRFNVNDSATETTARADS
jgi:hypothetical protein